MPFSHFSFLSSNYFPPNNDDVKICKEAKTKNEACEAITDFVENESAAKEAFTTSYEGVNEWHKKAGGGGGGCIIL